MKPTGKEMAETLANFVNRISMQNEAHAFVETLTKQTHRTLQQQAFELMIKSISAWAALPDNMTDLRNEATVKACRVLWQAWQENMGSFANMPYI